MGKHFSSRHMCARVCVRARVCVHVCVCMCVHACVCGCALVQERERGPYGFGELNDAGRELLSFLSSHEGMVCNTRFQKSNIYKQIWRHPKSGVWHCIDYILTH